MREVVLDTETTGLSVADGHRIIEIGCIELRDHMPTGRTFHEYLNPEREMSYGAVNVHGLTAEFLADKPRFIEIADKFLDFVGAEVALVIHNAEFDLGFLNEELKNAGRPALKVAKVVDTVELARRKFPGAPASLDALCKRFAIDNSARTKHGALLDAELLSLVYLELIGGRQAALDLGWQPGAADATVTAAATLARPPRTFAPSVAELAAHAAFIAKIENPIWRA
ncbi:MAG: DNA polymerase III subunit epsilon [Alphaproteobacteria bacterium]|nr:DNA polymerase III subunit epsilon [Alphaproteobacteria bacterium]